MNTVYESKAIQDCKKICHTIRGSSCEKIKKIYFLPYLYRMVHTRYARYQPKIIFFQLCYLNRVEHEKCSEMCVWIVRFGQNLRKWDYFQ